MNGLDRIARDAVYSWTRNQGMKKRGQRKNEDNGGYRHKKSRMRPSLGRREQANSVQELACVCHKDRRLIQLAGWHFTLERNDDKAMKHLVVLILVSGNTGARLKEASREREGIGHHIIALDRPFAFPWAIRILLDRPLGIYVYNAGGMSQRPCTACGTHRRRR